MQCTAAGTCVCVCVRVCVCVSVCTCVCAVCHCDVSSRQHVVVRPFLLSSFFAIPTHSGAQRRMPFCTSLSVYTHALAVCGHIAASTRLFELCISLLSSSVRSSLRPALACARLCAALRWHRLCSPVRCTWHRRAAPLPFPPCATSGNRVRPCAPPRRCSSPVPPVSAPSFTHPEPRPCFARVRARPPHLSLCCRPDPQTADAAASIYLYPLAWQCRGSFCCCLLRSRPASPPRLLPCVPCRPPR